LGDEKMKKERQEVRMKKKERTNRGAKKKGTKQK
jgi:hypothetical protein